MIRRLAIMRNAIFTALLFVRASRAAPEQRHSREKNLLAKFICGRRLPHATIDDFHSTILSITSKAAYHSLPKQCYGIQFPVHFYRTRAHLAKTSELLVPQSSSPWELLHGETPHSHTEVLRRPPFFGALLMRHLAD
jgi:hypothetical protein